jgi:hypothetical protein
VPDEYREGSPVLLLFQGPGADEEAGRRMVSKTPLVYEPMPPAPLIGATGLSLTNEFLPVAGLNREDVSLANATRCRYNHLNKLPEERGSPINHPIVRQAIQHCQHHHYKPPASVKLVVAAGEVALWASTGEGLHGSDEDKGRTIAAWRGWLLPWNPPPRPLLNLTDIYTPPASEVKVLVTYHVAAQWTMPWMYPAFRVDWHKVGKVLAGTWPHKPPTWTLVPPTTWPSTSAFDTEFGIENGYLLRYSLAYLEHGQLVAHVVESAHAWEVLTEPGSTVYLHNLPADVKFLNSITGGKPLKLEDTMIQHHVLWGDLPHNLNFVGSIYARINRWKHLVQVNPIAYSGGDAVGTLDAGMNLTRELAHDSQSEWIYRESVMPQWQTIMRSKEKGIKVNQARVQEALAGFQAIQEDAIAMAQAAAGWNINLGSPPQLTHWIFGYEEANWVHPLKKVQVGYKPREVKGR